MANDIPNVPPIQDLSDLDMDKIKSELGLMEAEAESGSETDTPIVPLRRRRGRPRKYPRDQFDRPIKDKPLDEGIIREKLGTLPSPPLTGKDSREIALRLKGILIGTTGLGAVLNPAIQMTEKEAENISTPLTAYLLRTEATSQIARRVLNEYDIAAFVIATLAYMVRVIKDVRSERESNSVTEDSGSKRETLQRVGTSQRLVEPSIEQSFGETTPEDANGQEGPINSEWASTATKLRDATEV